MKLIGKKTKKSIVSSLFATAFFGSCVSAPTPASAMSDEEFWRIAQYVQTAQTLIDAPKEARDNIIYFGMNPINQNNLLNSDMAKNGRDTDYEHNKIVKNVMEQLIEKGYYQHRLESLPFRYRVNNSEEWNACCNAANYVSFNRGLVEDLKRSDDALAAIASHEMTHGLQQHVANDTANTILAKYGANIVAGALNDQLQATLLNTFTNYAIVKNFSTPSEAEADEKGFYLMASAGFNPGGFPIAMAHMGMQDGFYNPNILKEIFVQASTHPKTKVRLERAIKRMEDYSIGHVSVKNQNEVFIDNNFFVKTSAGNNLEDWENAYLVAGSLAKGFHDNKMSTNWNFLVSGNRVDFLTNEKAYQPLKNVVGNNVELAKKLEGMVTQAYSNDRVNGVVRDNILKEEVEYNNEVEKTKKDVYQKDNVGVFQFRTQKYWNLGLYELGKKAALDGLEIGADSNLYEYLGLNYYDLNQKDEALKAYTNAINNWEGKSNEIPEWYLTNRAEVYADKNMMAEAEADFAKVKSLKKNWEPNSVTSLNTMAKIHDSKGNAYEAMNSYKKLIMVSARDKDDRYLKFIPEKYKKMMAEEQQKQQEGMKVDPNTGNVDMTEFNN